MTKRWVTRVAVVLVMAVAVSCGGGGRKARPAATVPEPTGPTTTLAAVPAPLTGLPADPVLLRRPALVVKIDNIISARPQAGLHNADVIYEELAEGGLTRFLAVFHSRDADPVGPVRSVRPSDPELIAPLNPLFAYSGGAPAVLALLKGALLTDVGFDVNPDAYNRRSDRRSPQNLYSTTPRLFAKAPRGAVAPPAFSPFLAPGAPFAAAGAAPATRISLAAGPSVGADYEYDAPSGTWRRISEGRPHLLEGGGQLAPTTVIVQFVAYEPFPADSMVFVARTVGTGDAVIMTGGTVTRGKWSKPSATSVTTYTDASGARITLPAGQTLVHLVRPGSRFSTR